LNERQLKKLNAIEGRKEVKKELRQPFDCLIELGLAFCFQQNASMGGGGGEKLMKE
jgi:hypothetical protein